MHFLSQIDLKSRNMKLIPYFYSIVGQFHAKIFFFRKIWGKGSMTLMSSYLHSVLKENVIPASEVGSSIDILSQTLSEQSPYSTLGLRPRVEYENSSPRVWERILILLPPSEGGMYYSSSLCLPRMQHYYLSADLQWKLLSRGAVVQWQLLSGNSLKW